MRERNVAPRQQSDGGCCLREVERDREHVVKRATASIFLGVDVCNAVFTFGKQSL